LAPVCKDNNPGDLLWAGVTPPIFISIEVTSDSYLIEMRAALLILLSTK